MFPRCLLGGIWLLVLLISGCNARKWDYEPLAISGTSSDVKLIKIEPKIERLGRGEFAVSGRIEWNFETTNETMVEAFVYRSQTGEESDYKGLPWTIPKQTLYEHMDTFYKDVSMKNFKHCSNFPQFTEKFQPPLPKKIYVGDKCMIDGDGLPDIIPPGYYKVIVKGFGPNQPTWGGTGIFKITTKIF
uniref:Uncharacterized protein LOC108041500 n=1 Tax=Drosophila rhopaloa TaxID=1041015 RepID=A0A6P4EIW2_DRORH